MTPTRLLSVVLIAAAGLLLEGLPSAQAGPSITGAWSLNREASDTLPDGVSGPGGRGRAGGPAGRGGRGGRGGFGGGLGRGGGFGGRGGARGANREDLERRMEAMRSILQAAERLTITQTDSMVIITTDQGVTTRLATDGSKVKDESTGIERRSRFEAGRLVTDITGAAGGRITETYAVDAATGQLIVTLQLPERRNRDAADEPQALRRVYEPQR